MLSLENSRKNPVAGIYLPVEKLKIAMNQDSMNLLNLYYYDQDRRNLKFVLTAQEVDRFAYYCSNHYTFYRDEMPDVMFVEIGTALSLREHFFVWTECAYGMHRIVAMSWLNIMQIFQNKFPYIYLIMMVNGLLMFQLRNYELWIHLDCKDEFRILE